ncbi:MAG: hypothetical protein DDT42_01876 [candidate division WS2 bacterium]|uniref:Uncharacterized protein n=1 Tax=Psychracetigena formicireducens TaxID=2986056 RepID=A0A9E2BI68_PSYF1|nr:hypothetical protein [Candidatus Psychracetigena formicireducens]
MNLRFYIYLLVCGVFWGANQNKISAQQTLFLDVVLKIDTSSYSLNNNRYVFQNQSYLAFRHKDKQPEVELLFYPLVYNPSVELRLMPSGQFEEVDSLLYINGSYRTVIQFTDLSSSQFVSLIFEEKRGGQKIQYHEIKLLPNLVPVVRLPRKDDDLFIGEVKEFVLTTQYQDYIRTSPDWVSTADYDYRILYDQGLKLQLLPKVAGKLEISITPTTRKFYINAEGEFVNQAKPIKATFNVKNTRLQFLSVDVSEIPFEFSTPRGIEIQIDYNRNLQLKKTYRIEDQIEPGGVFIGELYTRSMLNNDKVLCWIRPFALHKISDGYLYLKDGDESKFITNLNINPKQSISKVSILREGGDWSNTLSLNPGENAFLKIEGTGLNKATFSLDEGIELKPDTVNSNENVRSFRNSCKRISQASAVRFCKHQLW